MDRALKNCYTCITYFSMLFKLTFKLSSTLSLFRRLFLFIIFQKVPLRILCRLLRMAKEILQLILKEKGILFWIPTKNAGTVFSLTEFFIEVSLVMSLKHRAMGNAETCLYIFGNIGIHLFDIYCTAIPIIPKLFCL